MVNNEIVIDTRFQNGKAIKQQLATVVFVASNDKHYQLSNANLYLESLYEKCYVI